MVLLNSLSYRQYEQICRSYTLVHPVHPCRHTHCRRNLHVAVTLCACDRRTATLSHTLRHFQRLAKPAARKRAEYIYVNPRLPGHFMFCIWSGKSTVAPLPTCCPKSPAVTTTTALMPCAGVQATADQFEKMLK